MIDPSSIDWNEIWADAQQKNIASGIGGECWTAWNDKAEAREYFLKSTNGPAAQERVAGLCRMVKPESRVLDIGAGPGNITIPLSKIVTRITAVEPAGGMLEIIREQIKLGNSGNILLVGKRWDDINVGTDLEPPYDLCFASFSLGMTNLRESIEKMIAVTTGDIVLFWHAGLQSWDEDSIALWPLLHGKQYHPVPQSNIIFNLLYSMGIYPDITVLRHNRRVVYESFDDIFEHYARRYDVVLREQRKILGAYIRSKFLVYDGDSMIRFTNSVSMRITWKSATGAFDLPFDKQAGDRQAGFSGCVNDALQELL
jgi:SAM-dependent methyltransferase